MEMARHDPCRSPAPAWDGSLPFCVTAIGGTGPSLALSPSKMWRRSPGLSITHNYEGMLESVRPVVAPRSGGGSHSRGWRPHFAAATPGSSNHNARALEGREDFSHAF